MLEQSHTNLMKELGYSQLQKLENSEKSTQEQRDGARLEFLQRYRSFLIGQNKDKKLPETYTEALHIIKDELVGWTYQMPLSFPNIKNKNEQNSYSLFKNNILNQRLNGTNAINIAEIGGHAVDKELKFVTIKGERVDEAEFDQIAHAEIAISWQLANIADLKPGMMIEIDQVPESVRRAIIYRTPTEGRNSMLPAMVKYILPQNVSHGILTPGEITKQMGTDFDFDKSTIIMPNFKVDKLSAPVHIPTLSATPIAPIPAVGPPGAPLIQLLTPMKLQGESPGIPLIDSTADVDINGQAANGSLLGKSASDNSLVKLRLVKKDTG